MEGKFTQAAQRAIAKLVTDFQGHPDRFWNERDLHWGLFCYLKQEGVVEKTYVTQLIRAEFPTLKKFGARGSERGHYDLVILDPHSYASQSVQRMTAQAPWDDFLRLIKVMIAIEIKLWLARLPFERAKWDIQKLTEPPHNVLHAYFLNFVQLDFSRPYAADYYRELRDHLLDCKTRWPSLRILCVPSDTKIQPDSNKNWL